MFLPRSKEDQLGKGRTTKFAARANPALCPLRALEQWLALSSDSSSPLFRVVHGGRIGCERIHTRAVSRAVQRSVKRAEIARRLLGPLIARRRRDISERARAHPACHPGARGLARRPDTQPPHRRASRRRWRRSYRAIVNVSDRARRPTAKSQGDSRSARIRVGGFSIVLGLEGDFLPRCKQLCSTLHDASHPDILSLAANGG